ncbi:helix-turn-helix domain-containing protein [Kibdelosporangium philippinense]|uniref:Helix-turn-helix domain-containing protein n=1 Tax=Kibdelosporangium philippinense TaxID=211113 RepID=A0ABS8ZVA1_9PSEU|nr:helix-turn-helix domain-containing protein [Kibdelosporangium philippinense]MCE7011514.1 helix-turn-helix domain-containing protein [Kibdelosporangium philippinense]
MKEHFTVQEAADYMNTTVRFVRRLISERRIPFHRLGRHVRLKRTDVDTFIDAGRVEAFDAVAARRHYRRAS